MIVKGLTPSFTGILANLVENEKEGRELCFTHDVTWLTQIQLNQGVVVKVEVLSPDIPDLPEKYSSGSHNQSLS